MAGFPKKENTFEIGHNFKRLAGPVSLSSSNNPQPGPGRKNYAAYQSSTCELEDGITLTRFLWEATKK
jgi:hypothetical protein